MKKLIYLIILLLILGLVLTGCFLSNVGQVPANDQSGITYLTKGGSGPFPLYAGQDMLVGNVLVWNDDEELCVRYELNQDALDEGWLLTETHIAVAYVLDGIPQTKKGNPIPGQFPYGDDNLGGEESYEECIPFEEIEGGIECDVELYIAAHAKIQKLEPVSEECLVSGAGSDDVLYLDEGTPGYPVGYTAIYQTYSGTPTPSVLAWTHSAWASYGVAGAEWISSSYMTENTDYNTWRLFSRNFTLPDNAVNITGSLTMNCDNGEEVYLNTNFVGDGSPAIVYGGSLPSGGGRHGWDSVENWDISSQLMAGSNELWTMTRNYGWAGGPTGNPTGLIYKLCYEYDLVTEESAWAANEEIEPEDEEGTIQFDGKNWATYFTYTVEPVLLETLTVDSAAMAGSDSFNVLDEGKCYKFKVIGTWTNRGWEPVDAEYTSSDDWTNVLDGPSGYDVRLLELQVNEEFVDWGVYNPGHTYYLDFLGIGSTVNFRVFDGDPTTNTLIPGWYGDNVGSLTVEIYLVP